MAAQNSSRTDEVEALLARGEVIAARAVLDDIAAGAGRQPRLAHDVAQLYMRLAEPALAEPLYARAVSLEPTCAAYHYNHSTALIALGRMDAAEAALDRVIAMQPGDHDAWYNRATLRKQTPDRNHVAAIKRALQQPVLEPAAQVPLYYALAKELEDLGEFAPSFVALTRGASIRRSLLSYRVEDDVAIMRAIAATFDCSWLRAESVGCDDPRPVFVVGLPRSGTTLVERILSSHSAIGSHGESTDLAMSLMTLAGKCSSKTELLTRSTRINLQALGNAYSERIARHADERVVDKTPANFLYLGLIARALPNARIVYVRREPMDVCHAMYKTLFRMAYPFSYALDDLGQYWLAFDALMRHWQDNLPNARMLTIDYEQLVTEPEATSRALLQHVGMRWEDACMRFERNPLPSLTASAAQVRKPMYTSSVGLWQQHAVGLAPLRAQLEQADIQINTGTST